jgi:type II secretion system protein G
MRKSSRFVRPWMWFRLHADGFTLIELLIVVAIIAILAAIAIPNFLEAQTRAKVSRSKSDLRTIATALESYAVDNTQYPPNFSRIGFNTIPPQLTSPIPYLTDSYLVDPFAAHEYDRRFGYGSLARYYTYDLIKTYDEFLRLAGTLWEPPIEAIDSSGFNPNALLKYGLWRLVSNGPDRMYNDPDFVFGSDPLDPNGVLLGADVVYDPTNGTISKGNILRTQRETEKRF